jgi:WD40 repeat protein
MTSTAHPPLLGASLPCVRRTFTARPFQTDGDLLALAFAADETLWSVEDPGVLRHWDVMEQRQLGWHHLEELATLFCFSDGAKLLASGSNDICVWDTASGEIEATWSQSSWVTALAFHPDGRKLASGHDDGSVCLWDWESQELLHERKGHRLPVSALAFSSDGRMLASAGEDRIIRLWNPTTGAEKGKLVGHTDRIPALAWQPGQHRLVSVGWDTTARIWDVDARQPIILLNTHAGQVHALAFNADGTRLAVADSANTVHLWDAHNHRPLQVLAARGGEVRHLAFGPSGMLASGGAERILTISDPQNDSTREPPLDPLQSRTVVAVTEQGRRLTSLGAGTGLRIWDSATGETRIEPEVAGPLRAFAASPDGRWYVVSLGDRRGTVNGSALMLMLHADTGKRRGVVEGPSVPVTALAFSPDSQSFASGSYQSSDVWLWEAASCEPNLILPGVVENCCVEQIRFDPTGNRLAVSGVDWMATGGTDGEVALWDVPQRRLLFALSGGATGLAFHPEGRLLATASLVQTIRIWDLTTRQVLRELRGHSDAIVCVAYSPDGRWLASGGDDLSVRLWDATTGSLAGLAELDTQVKDLTFSPDGRFLYTGNGNAGCYQLEVSRLLGEGG